MAFRRLVGFVVRDTLERVVLRRFDGFFFFGIGSLLSWLLSGLAADRYLDIGLHPGGDGRLRMDRAKEAIRTAGSTWPAVTRCEVMTEDVRAWNMVLLQQPANKPCGSGSLWRGKRIGFTADVFDTDGGFVCAHTVIGTVAVADHLVNVAVSIDDVVRGHLAAV